MGRLTLRAANGHVYCASKSTPKDLLEKLADYEDAEEQGELVLYPTKAYFIMNNKVYEGWVQEAVYSVCRKPLFDIRYDDNSLASYRGYLGNTVFLERTEAEQVLVEMKGV